MVRSFVGLGFLWVVCCLSGAVTPLTVKEVSLMLRSGYSSDAVLQELSKRKCSDILDSTSEKQLVQAGANQSLIATLESGVYQLSSDEIAAFAKKQQSESRAEKEVPSTSNLAINQAAPSASPNVQREQQQGGTVYDHLKGDLVYWHDGSLVPVDDEALQKKKYYLLFFSAIWSKGGRQITPRLVDYYNRVEPQHPEFELVFFSIDRSPFAMENYISQMNMPWPAVAYDKRDGKAGAIEGNLAKEVPTLVLAEASGKILSQSADTEASFDKVLADLDKLLAASR
jgi:hypothetical protein